MRRAIIDHGVRALAALLIVVPFACVDQPITDPLDSPLGMAAPSAVRPLDVCDEVRAPAGTKLVRRLYAEGAQIYRWNGFEWSFQGPSATLFADAGHHSVVGTHYEGPTWESRNGGTVRGTVVDRCTPDPASISWLLLAATPSGPGMFNRVAFIQRVNTSGGLAPAAPGTFTGQESHVPYTTEYLFYIVP